MDMGMGMGLTMVMGIRMLVMPMGMAILWTFMEGGAHRILMLIITLLVIWLGVVVVVRTHNKLKGQGT